MNVRAFVILSSLTLCAWLTATYIRVVPMHTYGTDAGVQAAAPVEETVESPVVAK